MSVELNKTGVEILKKNLKDVPDLYISRPKPSKIFMSFLLLSLTAFALYYIHSYALLTMLSGMTPYNEYLLWVKLVFCICLFSGVLLALDIVLLAIKMKISHVNHKFSLCSLIVSTNTFYMRTVIALLISSILLIYYEKIYTPTTEVLEETELTKGIFLVENFAYIILSIALFLTVQLLKSLIILFLKYKMHFANYKARIEKNNQQNEVLYMINRMTGREMYSNVNEWAIWVFQLFTSGKPKLTRTCCRHFFSEKETEEIFEMFDTNSDGSVSQSEFISVFFGVIREKYFLNEALLQKNTLLNKLSWVFSSISVPIGLFLSSAVLGGAIYMKNYVSAISGAILSLSFIFSALAGEVFRSLIFIFLVRPFEAGDVLRIDDKILMVKELGLLYTSFSIQSLTNYVQNTKLMDKYIVNYRLSDVEEKVYTYTFKFHRFKAQLENLKGLLSNHVSKDTKKYTGNYSIRNFKHSKNSSVTVDIVVEFQINFQYVKGLIKNEDDFVFYLEEMFKSLEIELAE